MRTWFLMLGSVLSLTACGAATQTKIVVPEVPRELREPVPISDRQAITLRDLTVLATEHLGSAQAANAKIVATDKILACAEARAARDKLPEGCAKERP